MQSYNINFDADESILDISFGEPATNEQIVRDAAAQLDEMTSVGMLGGKLLKINGPSSLPAAFTICHKVSHLFGAIAIFDPKLQAYVVAVSHTPDYKLGDLI